LEIDKMAKSEYLQREDAAKKQLGAKGVAKRVKQVPRAARLSVKELTGVNISRKGVTADPASVGLAAAGFLPFGKSLSVAAKALKPVGMRISSAAGRVAARSKRAVKMASSEIENAKWMDSQAAELYEKAYREKNRSLGGFSNRYESKGRGAFDEDLGYNLSRVSSGVSQNEGERLVRQGLARKVTSRGGDSVEYFSTGGDALSKESARISSLSSTQRAGAEATLRAAGSRANKQAAAAEIKRRLAALKAAKKRPSAPRNPKIPSAL
jgi:hypothetical protein